MFLSNVKPATHSGSKSKEEFILFCDEINFDPAYMCKLVFYAYCDIHLLSEKYLFLQLISKDTYPLVLFVTAVFIQL